MNLKKLEEKLSIKSWLPDYKINKMFFRGALVFLVLYFFVAWGSSGFVGINKTYAYAECSYDSFGACINPFYDICNVDSDNYEYDNVICDKIPESYYVNRFLLIGESVGEKPSVWLTSFVDVFFLVILLSFVLNHLVHNRRYFYRRSEEKKNENAR